MVALGSFGSRVGASSPRRANFGNNIGNASGNGVGNGGNKMNASGSNLAADTTQGVNRTKTNTPWSNQPNKGWVDRGWSALVGERNRQNDMAAKSGTLPKEDFTDKLGGVKYEVVKDGKRAGAGGVRYKSTGYKKGKILIDKSVLGDGTKGRKNFAKEIGKLSKRGSLNKVTGKLSSGTGKFARDFSERNISKISRRSERSGKSFSKGTMKDLMK